MERVHGVLKKADLDNSNVKWGLYCLLAVAALSYFVRAVILKKTTDRSWLKLRRSSPDPERSDDINKYAAKMKSSDRPFGSKLNVTETWKNLMGLHYVQHGSQATLRDPQHHRILIGL